MDTFDAIRNSVLLAGRFKNMIFPEIAMSRTVTAEDYEAVGALLAEYDQMKAEVK